MKSPVAITGAGSGIGQAIALEFSKLGYECILIGRSKKKLIETEGLLQTKAILIPCDIASEEELKMLPEILRDQYQVTKLYSLINCAGIYSRQPFSSTSIKDWREIFEVNLFGQAELTRHLLPLLEKERGSIINIASTLADRPVPQTSIYAASKAALINWTKCLALELAPLGIRVNCVSPGIVDTPIHEFFPQSEDEKRKSFGPLQPLGRIGKPKDIAEAVIYFAQSQWTTGTVLNVDGGINL